MTNPDVYAGNPLHLYIESGRQAVTDADGIRLLYQSCQDMLEWRELESLIFTSSLIIRKCFPQQRLPTNTNKAALIYKLPPSDFYIPQSLSKGKNTFESTRDRWHCGGLLATRWCCRRGSGHGHKRRPRPER